MSDINSDLIQELKAIKASISELRSTINQLEGRNDAASVDKRQEFKKRIQKLEHRLVSIENALKALNISYE